MERRELLNQAWSITWRNKSLWIIALLGAGGELVASLLLATPSLATSAVGTSMVTSIINTVVSFVFTVFVSGALIKMVDVIAGGGEVRLNDGLQAGMGGLLPLLLVSVVLAVPGWILLVIWTGSFTSVFGALGQPNALQAANLPMYFSSMFGIGGLSIIVGILTGAIAIGAQREVVLNNTPVLASIQRGWQLFRERFREYFGIAAMLFLIGLAVALLFACAIVPMVNSMVTNMVRTSATFNPASLLTSPAYVVFLIVSLVVNSLVTVLVTGVWTLAFRKWQGK